ncbi:hypothetical protein H4R33_002102 [Dimargaris cristalligena]|nr:hypothetical protein H4R33_002102 [Dimargaris cristalligena]
MSGFGSARLVGWGANLAPLVRPLARRPVAAQLNSLKENHPSQPGTLPSIAELVPQSPWLEPVVNDGSSPDAHIKLPTALEALATLPGLEKDIEITAIAAGHMFSMVGIRSPSSNRHYLAGFGVNSAGQLGTCEPSRGHFGFHLFQSSHPVLGLSCGRQHTLALFGADSSSTEPELLMSCGDDQQGQSALPTSSPDESESYSLSGFRPTQITPPSDESEPIHIKSVGAGLDHSVLMSQNGHIYTMGWAADGQVGQGSAFKSHCLTARRIPGIADISFRKISTKSDFTWALDHTGQVYFWGNSEYGQSMLGHKTDRILEAVRVPLDFAVKDVAAGGTHSLLLSDGYVGLVTQVFAGLDYCACITVYSVDWAMTSQVGSLM